MKFEGFRPTKSILFVVFLFMGGCTLLGGGTQHPTKNYVLSSMYSQEQPPQPLADLSDIGILVGPIRMAMYLDRSDVVIRNSQNEVEIADFSSWAGPLPENFSRVLAENLSLWLNTKKVAIFPGTKLAFYDYSIGVNVTRFDGRPGDKAHLRARWVIMDKKRKNMLFQEHTVLSQPIENDSIEAMIASQSRTVVDFSREIAEAIKKLVEEKTASQ
jgi:uncharacterized lipoprotein YmbA